jgi:hypothetical protein
MSKSARGSGGHMTANISFAPEQFVAMNVAEDNRMKQVAEDDALGASAAALCVRPSC